MTLPDWMTKELVENTLVDYFQNKSVHVVDMVSKFAVPIGDNFCSDLFRLTVSYKSSAINNTETISLIAKVKPETGAKQMLTNEIPVFEKESEMFNVTLKKLHQLLGAKCLSAECLQAEVGTHGWLILQDLAPLGYTMADRKAGLDMNHCLMVLNKVAKMHASSAVLYEKEPNSMTNYDKGIYTNQLGNPIASHFCNSGIQSLALAVDKWQGFTQYSSKLTAIAEHIFEKVVKGSERRAGFNVLNHGDLWVNNILFKYDSNGDPVDCKFVDFQFSVYTSPAIDLQYFIYTSVKQEIERTQLNRLLDCYYEELVKQLKKLNYPKEKIPTLEWIRKDFSDRSLYGFAAAFTVLPIVKAPPRKDATFDEIFKSDNEDADYYYAELVKQLKKLNYPEEKIPTLEWIRKDFFDRSLYGFVSAITVLPIAKAPPRKDATFDEILNADDGDASFRQASYNEPDFRSMMEKLLPHFENLGLLNN
ncbi:uncharacterized protein CBL_08326 [Carabus blaptoides fortunei]